jgi:hypothetical protein
MTFSAAATRLNFNAMSQALRARTKFRIFRSELGLGDLRDESSYANEILGVKRLVEFDEEPRKAGNPRR